MRIADQGYLLARRSVRLKVMTKLVAPLLDTLAEIADDERDILLDTFRVWMENNDPCAPPDSVSASPRRSAIGCIGFRNAQVPAATVRRRRAVLAFEVQRRLM